MHFQALSAVEEVIDDGAYSNLDMRGVQEPVPNNLEYFLSDGQMNALYGLLRSGWSLAFVRRPLFLPATVVVKNDKQGGFGVVELDGSISFASSLLKREEEEEE